MELEGEGSGGGGERGIGARHQKERMTNRYARIRGHYRLARRMNPYVCSSIAYLTDNSTRDENRGSAADTTSRGRLASCKNAPSRYVHQR